MALLDSMIRFFRPDEPPLSSSATESLCCPPLYPPTDLCEATVIGRCPSRCPFPPLRRGLGAFNPRGLSTGTPDLTAARLEPTWVPLPSGTWEALQQIPPPSGQMT